MQKFDTNTIEYEYIQNLLLNTYVPTVPFYKNDDDVTYEFPTGTEESHVITYITPLCIKSKTFYRDTEKTPVVKVIESYQFGKRYPNITKNFVNKRNYYNTELHEALGDYLRWYSKYKDINLMPLYNCFSNRYIDDFSLPIVAQKVTTEVEEHYIVTGSTHDTSKQLLAFPVRLGKTYQIACDNNQQCRCQLGLYESNKLVTHDEIVENGSYKFKTTPLFLTFSAPSTYSVSSTAVPASLERYLYLFIELPSSNNSSVVVLERFDSNDYCQNPSLFIKNYYTQHAFSDNLIQYLLGNVVVPGYEIQHTVKYFQVIMSSQKFKSLYGKQLTNYIAGVFDQGAEGTLHEFIYHTFSGAKIRYEGSLTAEPIRDFTGYIDKDVESLILKAAESTKTRVIEG